MGHTNTRQKKAKEELDNKLRLSTPSRELLEELAIECSKNTNDQAASFQYAFALSKSNVPSELRYAVTILDGLVNNGYEFQVDAMYGAATALYLLGDYQEVRDRCEAILRSHPDSRVAKELHLAAIEAEEQQQVENAKQLARNGVIAATVVGGLGLAISLLLKKH
jgi:predicted Zn-dependent protease